MHWARIIRSMLAALTGGLAMTCASVASAQSQTAAGENIVNVASVTYTIEGETESRQSNTVQTLVDERLDVQTTASRPSIPARPGDQVAVAFIVTNGGNGQEAFTLAANAASGCTIIGLALDTDGDGLYDPARDTAYTPGSNDPGLAPGGTVTVFVICEVSPGAAEGSTTVVSLTATAVTGSGAPGSTFDSRGDAGGDAVVGGTSAASTAARQIIAVSVGVELIKSQSVQDADGGNAPVPGSIITYSLTARVFGAAPIDDAVVSDVIPVGATFVPGSLTLDGVALSDAADADAGAFDGAAIRVNLGGLAAPAERFVSFQVRID